jgi:DNA polymerase III subunit gamma/tau
VALALYRKYRPRTFAEVIGQEQVTQPLIQALRTGRLHHAYLFSGPRGCGKTSSARILARSLNCEKGPTPEPCGECESCRALAPDGPGSIDVIEIDAASHGGVDDARELRERAFFAPAISRFKVYIIDEAHMVSSAGFNALLKLVEEPPDYVKFVFATTEPEKVLGTIKSRTHHYPFRLPPPGVLRGYLEQLCEAEGVTVDPKVLPLVVRAGGGFFRDTLSVLDQLIAGAGPEGVTYARAVALLGVTDAGLIDDVCDALAASDPAAAFSAIERVVEAGHDPRRFTGDLLERLRDLILLRQVPDAATKGLIEAPDDQLERMQAQAARIGPATLSRWAEIVHNGLIEMRGTASTRLLLELITARMLLPTVDSSEAGILARLERLEQGIPAAPARSAPAAPTAPAERPAERTPPAPAERPAPPRKVASEPDDETPPSAETEASGSVDAPDVRRAWDEIVQLTGRSNKRIAAMARDGVVREVQDSTIVLVFKAAFHANSVSADPSSLLDAIHQVIGGQWQLRCEVSSDQRGSSGRSPGGGGRSAAGKAEGSPPTRSASPTTQAERPTTTTAVTPLATVEDWPETAPIGAPAESPPETPTPPTPIPTPTRTATAAAKPTPEPMGVKGVKAATVADEDFGALDEPPYDPEFDGYIEDPGSREPTARRSAGQIATKPAAAGLPVEKTPAKRSGRAAAAEVAARAASRGGGARTAAPRTPAKPAVAGWAGDNPPAARPAAQPEPEPGFDPGDEPTDEVLDAHSARQSGEQQAVEALRQRFGHIEKIADL